MVRTCDYKLKHVLLFSNAFLALATEEPFNPLNISITGQSDSVVMQVGIHKVKLWKKDLCTTVKILQYKDISMCCYAFLSDVSLLLWLPCDVTVKFNNSN